MKVCPVCGFRLFDDMDTCYGCMHRFSDEDASAAFGGPSVRYECEAQECKEPSEDAEGSSRDAAEREDAAEKSMSPCRDICKGTWSARFNLASEPGRGSVPMSCVLTVEIAPVEGGSGNVAASG